MITQVGFDPFAWWMANELSFPILCRIAISHLVIPATSASVERQFYRAKTANNNRHQSMGEGTLSASVFLSSNMNFTERVLKPHLSWKKSAVLTNEADRK
jgi:hypothetical protein